MAKPGSGTLVAGAGMVVQLHDHVQDNGGILGGEGCCYSGDLSKDS